MAEYDGFDFSEFDQFTRHLLHSTSEAASIQRKMLREQGTKLARKTRAQARVDVKKRAVKRKEYTRKAGTYHKSLKRGKVYPKDGALQIRIYTNDPVGHLIEDGYTPKLPNGSKGKEQEAKKVIETAAKEFEGEFSVACEGVVDEIIESIRKANLRYGRNRRR